jgi:DNA-binding CsgD family transcriptional regulator
MAIALFFLILSGEVLIAALWALTVLQTRASRSAGLRALGRVMSLVYAAFLFGETYGLLLQGVQTGWFRGGLATFLLTVWSYVEVLGFMTLGVLIFVSARRVRKEVGVAGLVVEILTSRIPADVSIDKLNLTAREREVLDVIAAGQLSDREIADALYISPATAATHVRNILRKAGLHRRNDLLLLVSRELSHA